MKITWVRTGAICLLILWFSSLSSAAEAQKTKKQIYVSTIGLPFFPKEGDAGKPDFILYRIDSMEKSDRFLRGFLQRIEAADRNQKQFDMLQRVLTVRNYEKELVYIVLSPNAKGIKIEQPWHFKGERDLFFDASMDVKKKDQNMLYMRLYVVDKVNDTLKKVIVQNGARQELSWQEP